MVRIRTATAADAADIIRVYTPYVEHTAITFDTEIPTVAEYAEKINTITTQYPFLVAEDSGEIIGYAYASGYYGRAAYAWTVEISIYVKEQGGYKGVGSKLYQHLESQLQQQGIQTILSCLAYPNEPSERFHKKYGFKTIGHMEKVGYKHGKWHDTIWMQKHIGYHEENPQPVRMIRDI